jgi:hypothetical protein
MFVASSTFPKSRSSSANQDGSNLCTIGDACNYMIGIGKQRELRVAYCGPRKSA